MLCNFGTVEILVYKLVFITKLCKNKLADEQARRQKREKKKKYISTWKSRSKGESIVHNTFVLLNVISNRLNNS